MEWHKWHVYTIFFCKNLYEEDERALTNARMKSKLQTNIHIYRYINSLLIKHKVCVKYVFHVRHSRKKKRNIKYDVGETWPKTNASKAG